ncbi:glycine-rich protein 1 [Drosophila albomicans]|uniref:Glycine-rich protein 1 n=1 Tax=Drosophila albomicans TaxID=7291 RepID=A0A6P8X3B6_DROAB|nr:glycine-rich protein 1 [Drosophila albomicans]
MRIINSIVQSVIITMKVSVSILAWVTLALLLCATQAQQPNPAADIAGAAQGGVSMGASAHGEAGAEGGAAGSDAQSGVKMGAGAGAGSAAGAGGR